MLAAPSERPRLRPCSSLAHGDIAVLNDAYRVLIYRVTLRCNMFGSDKMITRQGKHLTTTHTVETPISFPLKCFRVLHAVSCRAGERLESDEHQTRRKIDRPPALPFVYLCHHCIIVYGKIPYADAALSLFESFSVNLTSYRNISPQHTSAGEIDMKARPNYSSHPVCVNNVDDRLKLKPQEYFNCILFTLCILLNYWFGPT